MGKKEITMDKSRELLNRALTECAQGSLFGIDYYITLAIKELEALKDYNSSQMCKKCAYNNANDNLKALYCNSCFRNYVDNFEELDK